MGQALRTFKAVNIPQFPDKGGNIFMKSKGLDDIDLDVMRHRAPDLYELTQGSRFNKEEIKIMYRGFKNETVNGLLKEEKFIKVYSQFFPHGDASDYARLLFDSFDVHKKGYLTFQELLLILSDLMRGDIEYKIKWIFQLYDVDKDGVISVTDLKHVTAAVFQIFNSSISQNHIEEFAKAAFERLDTKNAKTLSYQDFRETCLHDQNIIGSINIFDTTLL